MHTFLFNLVSVMKNLISKEKKIINYGITLIKGASVYIKHFNSYNQFDKNEF